MRAEPITPELLLAAYANGYFPMAASRESTELLWFNPEQRGILPLDAFHVPRSLARFMRKRPFVLRADTAFAEVLQACGERREETWINAEIAALYTGLWKLGFAHSIECWQGEALVGGLYGVALGGAFFGESMFSRVPGASKVALVTLVHMLRARGFTLLDAQFANDHLRQFGLVEVSREEYLARLREALQVVPEDGLMRPFFLGL